MFVRILCHNIVLFTSGIYASIIFCCMWSHLETQWRLFKNISQIRSPLITYYINTQTFLQHLHLISNGAKLLTVKAGPNTRTERQELPHPLPKSPSKNTRRICTMHIRFRFTLIGYEYTKWEMACNATRFLA